MDERKEITRPARIALWEAHGRLCAYTGAPVDFSELQIDHIIPVRGDERRKEELRTSGILSADFDINGFENLLPVKAYPNRQKTSHLGSDASIVFYLNLAAKVKSKVERLLASSLADNLRLKSYLQLKVQAEKNNVDFQDLIEFTGHQVEGEVPLRVSPGVDGPALTKANAEFASTLLNMPLALGRGTIQEVVLQTGGGGTVTCHTANEFLAAKAKGYWPLTNYDIKVFSMAEETAELLKAVRDSTYAPNSQLREPLVTLNSLERWSSEWVSDCFVDSGVDASKYETVAELVSKAILNVEEQDKWKCTFGGEQTTLSVSLFELMRADLDGDDEEEILVFAYTFAPTGTLGAGMVFRAKANERGILERQNLDRAST